MKMKVFRIFWGGIYLFLTMITVNPVSAGQKTRPLYLPKDDKILLLIGQDRESIKDYIYSMGMIPAGFMVYTSIQQLDGLSYPAIDRGAGVHDAQYLMDKYPNTVIQVGLYMVDGVRDTIRGKYDANIERLAQWIEKARVPVYLRIGYEFDLPANHYHPKLYKRAYRYIVEKLNQYGLKNVVYVWHSYGVLNEKKPLDLWYPGDDVVDMIGISYFQNYFQKDREAIAAYAAKKNKPLMIAESSPSEIGVDHGEKSWQRWYEPFFDFIDRHNVQIVSYINTDWDGHPMFKRQKWGDSRVQAHPYIYREWKSKMSQTRFLKSDYKIFQKLQ